jgi:2-polyprenyl-3-methyl-5-hydroxy-6-metoxy-1,4-benzoquinol methylase
MSGLPRLSICIPSYNLSNWVGGAVESALALGFEDEVEVVVVDDSSTDGSQDVLATFPSRKNLRIECSPERRGLVGNFNRAVGMSRGAWVTVLGADDELFPGYYRNLRPVVDRSDAVAFSQLAWMQWGDHETAFGQSSPSTIDLDTFIEMLGGAVCISTTAFRRDLFDAVGGFDPAVGTFCDFDLLFRIADSSGLPVRALGTEGGRYYPLRGLTWTRQEATSEATELIFQWIQLRRADLGPERAALAARSLATRARMLGKAQLASGNREGARRNFEVAVACTSGRKRLGNRTARLLTWLPDPLAGSALQAYGHAKSLINEQPSADGDGQPESIGQDDRGVPHYDNDRPEMLAFIPNAAQSLLDVGCATGRFGAAIRERHPATELVGVEPDPLAAERAAPFYDRVVCGEFPDVVPSLMRSGGFDVIVFNDVLEHMADPNEALDAARNLLSPTGVVVASIPNVRHITATGPLLLRGEWRYRDYGILDATHLRFFTAKSIARLFSEDGWTILGLEPINRRRRINDPSTALWIKALGWATLGRSDPFFVLQYAVTARPAGGASENPEVSSVAPRRAAAASPISGGRPG